MDKTQVQEFISQLADELAKKKRDMDIDRSLSTLPIDNHVGDGGAYRLTNQTQVNAMFVRKINMQTDCIDNIEAKIYNIEAMIYNMLMK